MTYQKFVFLICFIAVVVLTAWIISKPVVLPSIEDITLTPIPPTATLIADLIPTATPLPASLFWTDEFTKKSEETKSGGRGSKASEVENLGETEDLRKDADNNPIPTPSTSQRP